MCVEEKQGAVGTEGSAPTYQPRPQQCEFSTLSWPRKGEEQRWGVVTGLEMTKKNGCESGNGKQAGTALLGSKGNFAL